MDLKNCEKRNSFTVVGMTKITGIPFPWSKQRVYSSEVALVDATSNEKTSVQAREYGFLPVQSLRNIDAKYSQTLYSEHLLNI